ncbi:MAG: hypothetical protein AB7T27_03015 [Kiritimatiellia bacterium]
MPAVKDTHKAWSARCLLLFAACAGLWAFWWIRESELPLLAHGDGYICSNSDSFMRARLLQDAATGGPLNPRTWENHNSLLGNANR